MKIPDLSVPIEQLKTLIVEEFFEGVEPAWLSPLFNLVLIGLLLIVLLWIVSTLLGQIVKTCKEQFIPLFYDRDKRIQCRNRQFFAEHIEQEIRQLNLREEWKYYRFTELEAEVEAEGKRKGINSLLFWQPIYTGLRREKSLSKALEYSKERLIFVEGEPGSGKSVALRYVTQQIAHQARKSRNIKTTIPIYINLKKLERDSNQEIDRNFIESFIKEELNRVNDRDIEEFLETEFTKGIREGTWLFLFDSFDEIPEILSSVEADEAIKNYADAINDFLSGFNKCRGIIASRQFRGPKHLGWSRFRILPLENRRIELIRKVRLEPTVEKELIGNMRMAHSEIQNMTKNPMFLSLLCDYVKDGNPFPENGHSVFERYIEKRLNRDTDRLERRYHLEPSQIRKTAEIVAFCMSRDGNLGLSPTRQQIKDAMSRLGFRIQGNFDEHLNALEYLKIARTDSDITPGDEQPFTFAHRRFQEYFATCIVLQDIENVSIRELITDGRWRETAVVICQTQPISILSPIFEEVRLILNEVEDSIASLIEDPLDYINNNETYNSEAPPVSFTWTARLLHLLGLLQEGFASRIQDFPEDIKIKIGQLLVSASVTGTRLDKKYSLEVAGITPQPVLLWLLRNAFSIPSQWIQEVAYRQTSRLDKIPEDIAQAIRNSLLKLFSDGELKRKNFTTYAHLSRLDKSEHFLRVMRLLQRIVWIDIGLQSTLYLMLLSISSKKDTYLLLGIILLAVFNITFSSQSLKLYSNLLNISLLQFKRLYTIIMHMFSFENTFKFTLYFYFRTIPISLGKSALGLNNIYITQILFTSLLLWAICALLSAKIGNSIEVYWYPFLLLFPVIYISKNLNKILVNAKKHARNVFVMIFLLMMLYLLNTYFEPVLLVLLFILLPIGIFFIFKENVFNWYQGFLDWLRWKKWDKKKLEKINIEDMLTMLSNYHHKKFWIKLISLVIKENLLETNHKSEITLEELALTIEKYLYIKEIILSGEGNLSDQINPIFSSKVTHLNMWLKKNGELKSLRKLENNLDEIYLLLEQVRSLRQANSTQN